MLLTRNPEQNADFHGSWSIITDADICKIAHVGREILPHEVEMFLEKIVVYDTLLAELALLHLAVDDDEEEEEQVGSRMSHKLHARSFQ